MKRQRKRQRADMFRATLSYLKRILGDKSFYICLLLIFAICFTASADYDIDKNQSLSVWDLIIDTQRIYTGNISFSACVVSGLKGGSWLNMFLPLLLPLCFVNALCDDKSSGFTRYEVIRTGYRRLKSAKYVSAVLASGICSLIGYCLYVLVVLIRFPHIGSYDAERLSYVLTGIQMSLFDSVGIAGVYLVNMLDMLIYGMVMSLFSLIVTAYTENKYLICCIPFMVAYCLTQLGSWLIGLAVQDPCNTDEVLLTIGNTASPLAASGIVSGATAALACYYGVLILISFAVYVFFGKGGADKGA